MTCILITGSSGLVGRALRLELEAREIKVRGLDLRAEKNSEKGDVRDQERVRAAFDNIQGVVHLAAVSRVVWAEKDPDLCQQTNINGLRNVLNAAKRCTPAPWFIFASSREVYGQPERLPATEDSPLRPMNIYGRSKVEGERLVLAAAHEGLRASILRLSNVYGSTRDHADRVVTAFARGAVLGQALRVDGAEHTFDFTHLDDTIRGIIALIEHLTKGGHLPPPLHLVTGYPTTLGQLAELATQIAGSASRVEHAPPRSFDVARFYGCPERARAFLGWSPRIRLQEGLKRLILDFRDELGLAY